ncbi:MAG TPA: precorrin-6y C5,15-methyltransferase (decarboxylating) subunit CbiE [Candidatus Merdivicinus excrementipullorum]|uniref:Precorrin-6y C5,15-methyltransferase (Decarboxylating) subunit CbiE n=1 Tax=Candidatus Merdivicinus excrementipullorum TaxID=2840867 RepID=A0A9D1FLC1_9FIRM|nr:precorrin-6y C5,15-methyltransferase (decarboxylating) subunit CbiE [Candidatus Merdivicinus excrementipullorum]
MKYPCPCCGNLTLPVKPEDAVAFICPVCFWENDVFLMSDTEPSDENHGLTLLDGRTNYRKYGACCPEMRPFALERRENPMKPSITVAGIGMGNPDTMTIEVRKAVEQAEALIGAGRMLQSFAHLQKPSFAAITPEDIRRAVEEHPEFSQICVLMSGDVGFFSGAKKLRDALAGYSVRFLPGISSMVYFCSKLGVSWDDARWVSAHGREDDVLPTIRISPKTFLLTGSTRPVQAVCRELCAAGLGRLIVHAGERLSYPEERVVTGTAEELAGQEFDSLSVMLVENPSPVQPEFSTHGIPDEEFIRGKVPMTKFEVRCAAVSLLRTRPGGVIWDVGAGTGSVSVETALANPGGAVYAVEMKEEAVSLIRQNREKFKAWNLTPVEGAAPGALENLPAPDAVFIGGSTGNMPEIFQMIREKNPAARVAVSAISLETLAQAIDCFAKFGLQNTEISQIMAARAKEAGRYHLMMGQNPVYLISGQFSANLQESQGELF